MMYDRHVAEWGEMEAIRIAKHWAEEHPPRPIHWPTFWRTKGRQLYKEHHA